MPVGFWRTYEMTNKKAINKSNGIGNSNDGNTNRRRLEMIFLGKRSRLVIR